MFPREFRQILAELELLSHGRTQAFNATGRSSERDPRPSGEPHPEYLLWRDRFEREGCTQRLLEEARGALESLRRQSVKQKGEKPEALERRIVEGDGSIVVEGASPQEVADWARVTVRFVMNARRKHGRDQMTGRRVAGLSLEEMLGLGMGVREIAAHTGKPVMTVQYQLQKIRRRAA